MMINVFQRGDGEPRHLHLCFRGAESPLLPQPGAVLPAAWTGHLKGLPPILMPELLHIFIHKCPHGVEHCLEI